MTGLGRRLYWKLFGEPCFTLNCDGRMEIIKRTWKGNKVAERVLKCDKCGKYYARFGTW